MVARNSWGWLTKQALISGFLVTMLGVYAAFWLTGLGEQGGLDCTTKQRLHLAVLESQYNGTIAMRIVADLADTSSVIMNIDRLDSSAATAAFEDANALSFLPNHKVSLLRSYANAIATLNRSLETHQDVLQSSDYARSSTEGSVRQNVRSNAASVIAMAVVLQEEMKEYFDDNAYDHQEIERLEARVKNIKAKALRGEVTLSKEGRPKSSVP
ncbi:MAG TPA: hypothetical protein VFI02_11815 [Armatimonadota bacterium]|nr:hypothetical protein [Armatimonadota bacterium]